MAAGSWTAAMYPAKVEASSADDGLSPAPPASRAGLSGGGWVCRWGCIGGGVGRGRGIITAG